LSHNLKKELGPGQNVPNLRGRLFKNMGSDFSSKSGGASGRCEYSFPQGGGKHGEKHWGLVRKYTALSSLYKKSKGDQGAGGRARGRGEKKCKSGGKGPLGTPTENWTGARGGGRRVNELEVVNESGKKSLLIRQWVSVPENVGPRKTHRLGN